jgi:hypothetical protein
MSKFPSRFYPNSFHVGIVLACHSGRFYYEYLGLLRQYHANSATYSFIHSFTDSFINSFITDGIQT